MGQGKTQADLVGILGQNGLPGDDHEPGGVLRLVLDVFLHNGKAVLLGCLLRTDGGHAGRAFLGHMPGSGGGVGPLQGFQAVGLQIVSALGQRLGMGGRGGDFPRVLPHCQTVFHLHVHRSHNVEPVGENEIVDARDRTGGGVFHRQHPEVRLSLAHVLKDLLPGGFEFRLDVPEKAEGRLVGKSPRHPLAHDSGALRPQRACGSGFQLPDRPAALQQAVLLCPADGHNGAVQRGCGVSVLSSSFPDLVQDGLFPLRAEHGHARLPFQLGHPLRAVHAAQKQGEQFPVDLVDFLPELSQPGLVFP